MNTAPRSRTRKVCFFKPIFSLRLSISGDVILKTFTRDMSCAAMRSSSHMSEWKQSARSLLWRGQPNVAPSMDLEFCPGQRAFFSEKSTWMRACEFVMHRECSSLSHCSFPLLLLCYCLLSFCVAMLEELGQNG